MTEDELPHLVYSVDVLAEPEPISSKAKLDPFQYGVIVESKGRRGLLLPNLEGINTVDEQLAIALEKAGISQDEPYTMQRFKVDVYKRQGQLLEIIRQHYPLALGKQITKYAEPFVGGGAVLFDLLSRFAFQEVFISDTNRELINTYLVVRDNVDQLILLLGQLQKEYITLDSVGRKKYYYKKRDEYNSISITSDFQQNINKAALFVFLNRTCYNGLYRVNSKNEFNVPAGAYKNPRICDQDNLRAVSQLLQGVTICCGYYTLSESFIDDKTFVYFDPPYRLSLIHI